LIDTGTTNVILPSATVDEYFSAVPKAQKQSEGVYTVPCDAGTAALPNFTITFTPSAPVASFIQPSSSGGINTQPYHAVIPGEYFIGNPTGKNDGMCQAGINNVGSGQAWDIILGDVFLMSQLVVFDMADSNGSVDSNYPSHGQIGFAPKPSNATS
jgi:aspergillopepsin I